jgi:hypothetical protein
MVTDKFQTKIEMTVEEFYIATHEKLVSLIRELERVLGREKAHQIVSDWAESNAVNDIKSIIASQEKPPETFEDIKVLLRGWVNDLNTNNKETVSIVEETDTKSVCIVDECIYATVFNKLNAPDIGYLLHCKHDFAATPEIHPNLGLKRKKTVMQKDECCDFEYYWK